MNFRIVIRGAAALCVCASMLCSADTYILPPEDVSLIGDFQYTTAKHEDTLLDIARRNDLGQREIVLANPDVDRWLPREGTRVFLPKRYILPDAPRSGLVLNIAEMRLYYYPPAEEWELPKVHTHPISIGRMDWTTPLGNTRITEKVENPPWRPPESIKKEHAANGDPLPDVVPPGPDNPLGNYAMRLGIPGYLIHGTNKPFGVGMRVSHGCVRMLPEDIERLFPMVEVGTSVHIVSQPIKVGWAVDTLYIEVQPPFEEDVWDTDRSLALAMELIRRAEPIETLVLDKDALNKAVVAQSGIPVAIAKRSYQQGGSYNASQTEWGSPTHGEDGDGYLADDGL